ncbi:MAG: DNA mismatch repair protein MutS [Pirellulales bacterium]|nr:DNA mismatch repair protein MutS [Pirellulales bacterium]
MAASPMMQQYKQAKEACGDALLLFRMGDFYELFYDDAKTAARVLGLTLTSREKGENPIPMAGFPHHQLDGYLARIIASGYRAAICDQVENPKESKGLVRREVTRIVTRGTLTDDSLLDPAQSNYLAAIVGHHPVGLAWVDISTGRFEACTVDPDRLDDILSRLEPAECLVPEDRRPTKHPMGNPNQETGAPVHVFGILGCHTAITYRPPWTFAADSAREALTRHFGTKTLEGFGFQTSGTDGDRDMPAIRAAGAILEYLQETQKVSLAHLERLTPHRLGSTLEIDPATRRSLELTRTLRDGRREGSLLGVIDRTTTAMGVRMLADWLAAPLADRDAIDARLDAVAELVDDTFLTEGLRNLLRTVFDIERLLARVTTGRATPRDLGQVARTLAVLPKLKAKMAGRKSPRLIELEAQIELLPDIRSELDRALVDECPLSLRDGGMIRPGYDRALDDLRDLMSGGKKWIAQYQAKEMERTGIPNIKIGFNRVFGYYLEVTHVHADKVPADYIRKQTIKSAERYITPELKGHEEKVLAAEESAKELEYELFMALRVKVAEAGSRLLRTAKALAELDALASLADLARRRNYCRPRIVDEPRIEIIAGRHPVLDIVEPDGTFVPNDTLLDSTSGKLHKNGNFQPPVGESTSKAAQIAILTGPNMAGKSTYIRQVALLSILAQMGSFVPAKSAIIGIADRVFARVGASDELTRGQSTFMVEMTETARILNTATERSLVILDEIGRGTSTYDGISLAWSIVEYLHETIGCRTLFATHYHELTDLAATLDNVQNLNVAVREWNDEVVFLHQIVPGAADKSYGIHVARLAGIPREVNERAKDILAELEAEHLDASGRPRIAKDRGPSRGEFQLTLFGMTEHPLLDRIREVSIDAITPLEALRLIFAWQKELENHPPA